MYFFFLFSHICSLEIAEGVRAALGPSANLTVVDLEKLSFAAQLELIRTTDVLFGAHGAGLTHILFLQVCLFVFFSLLRLCLR